MVWPFFKSNSNHSIQKTVQSYNDPYLTQFNKTYQEIVIRKYVDIKYIPKLHNYKPTKFPIVLCHGLSGFDQLLLAPSIKYWLMFLKRHMEMMNLDMNDSDSLLQFDRDNAVGKNNTGGDNSGTVLYPKEGLMIDYWIGIADTLTSNGNDVIVAKVPPFGSIEERALALNILIKEKVKALLEVKKNQDGSSKYKGYGGEKNPLPINLIAHSMGGLDCRYLISRIKPKEYKILSLTTISTPHHGSEMADFLVQNFQKMKELVPLQSDHAHNSISLPICFYQLTTNFMNDFFNPMVPDDPNVKYFSFGATFKPNWFNVFHLTAHIVTNRTRDKLKMNDGLVTVKSAMWGKYLGTLYGLDHLDIINWQYNFQIHLNKLFVRKQLKQGNNVETLPKPNKLNILNFYLYIIEILSENGF